MAGRRRLMFAKDFTVNYLRFTALESGTFTLTIGSSVTVANFEYVEYSIDDGATWTRTDNVASTTVTITTPTIAVGNSVLWRGSGVRIGSTSTSNTAANNSIFSSTGQCNVSGDIRTLLGLNKPNNLTISTYIYKFLFLNMSKLKDASELIMPSTTNTNCFYGMFVSCTGLTKPPSLPATNVAGSAYRLMFSACTSLTSVPALPAETLGTYCYASMFNACSSLVTAQTTLPATTLNNYCYSGMFYDCTSLTTAPLLPAETVSTGCYKEMFRGCTSLISAPELPATEMKTYCYDSMFQGCTSLTTPPALPATKLQTYCYQHMFNGCTSLTSCPELSVMELKSYCYNGMFEHCTSIKLAPELPATTLASYCYYYMFYECYSLENVPELNALELVSYCYGYMFTRCSKINYAKALFTTRPDVGDGVNNWLTDAWLYETSTTGIFVKNINATWAQNAQTGIPTTWTFIYYDPSDDKYYTDQNKTTECDDHGNPL